MKNLFKITLLTIAILFAIPTSSVFADEDEYLTCEQELARVKKQEEEKKAELMKQAIKEFEYCEEFLLANDKILFDEYCEKVFNKINDGRYKEAINGIQQIWVWMYLDSIPNNEYYLELAKKWVFIPYDTHEQIIFPTGLTPVEKIERVIEKINYTFGYYYMGILDCDTQLLIDCYNEAVDLVEAGKFKSALIATEEFYNTVYKTTGRYYTIYLARSAWHVNYRSSYRDAIENSEEFSNKTGEFSWLR